MLEIQNKGHGNREWKPGCIKGKANSAVHVDLDLIWSRQAKQKKKKKSAAVEHQNSVHEHLLIIVSIFFCYKSICF